MDERDESTSAQPLDLSRHAQTETWGEYSQIRVQPADNTFIPWKLSSFSIFSHINIKEDLQLFF